jgi:hypothetical protein
MLEGSAKTCTCGSSAIKNNVPWLGHGLKEDLQEGGILLVGSLLRHNSMHELCLRRSEV